MTTLRQRMIEDMRLRGLAVTTQKVYSELLIRTNGDSGLSLA